MISDTATEQRYGGITPTVVNNKWLNFIYSVWNFYFKNVTFGALIKELKVST